jgi:hypothetical protein
LARSLVPSQSLTWCSQLSKGDWQAKVVRILLDDSSDLRELARIAEANATTFYSSANFRKSDLSNQDLSGLDLSSARLSEARLSAGSIPSNERNQRLLVNINHEIHSELRRRNPRQLSGHVDRLLARFYSGPAKDLMVAEFRLRSSRTALIRTMERELCGMIGKDYDPRDKRSLVSYFIFPSTRRLLVESDLYRFGSIRLSECARLAIYWMLLHDKLSSWR